MDFPLIANPITSIASLEGDLLIAVIAALLFIEETGVPIPFAPGDLLLVIAGIAIASDTVEPVPMLAALLVAISLGALLGREIFAAVGRPALMRIADALRFRRALERSTRLLRTGGAPAVFAGRLIPGLRIHTTQVAGVSNMPRLTFAAGLIPSVVVYLAVFVGLGALVGRPAVGLFHRAEHRFFVLAVTLLAVLAVVLSVRWLARRGALSTIEPVVLGVRRDFADRLEAALFYRSNGDAIWHQYPLVRRAWAAVLDLAFALSLTILILTAFSGMSQTEEVFDPQGWLLLFGVALIYRVPYEALSGQSIGKAAMGITVDGPNGDAPGWSRAAVRNLLGLLPVVWPVDAFLILRNRQRRRLCDAVTDTTVRLISH